MSYDIDLKNISLKDYEQHLRQQKLYPSRKILHEDLKARFIALAHFGIENVDVLKKAIGTRTKITEVSEKTGIPFEYLNILRREIGSLIAKRVKLTDFPRVDADTTDKLGESGIKNSRDFFDKMTPDKASKLGINAHEYQDLRALCDIARISGMGGIAARIFADAGYKSVEDIANADAQKMLDDTCTVNSEKRYYGGVLSVSDMQFCIDYAKMRLQFER